MRRWFLAGRERGMSAGCFYYHYCQLFGGKIFRLFSLFLFKMFFILLFSLEFFRGESYIKKNT